FCHAPARPDPAREAAWLSRLTPEFARFNASPPSKLKEIYPSACTNTPLLELLLAAPPAVISLHFGLLPPDWIARLKSAGSYLIASATNLDEARACARAGIDAVVAQGWEAGGHRGTFDPQSSDAELSTAALLQLLRQKIDLPVIAAGGIMDAPGIQAARDLGAACAQMGTAFIACRESLADDGYRAALASDAAQNTVMTRAISGRPARALANDFTALGADIPASEIPDYPIAYDAGKALNSAAKAQGAAGYGAQWAGQGAPLAQNGYSAGELIAKWEKDLRA
ncbi:MAG: nitronate monooxygenase, partial [Mangrovicoccus sp.]|nr:nitronate monooxygenase [Mangrovicoccus sp.]